jgi:hypothetical protein
MWTYSQSKGLIQHNGNLVGTGYSGHGDGLDAPDKETVKSVGPIPRGRWRIVQWAKQHPTLGPIVAFLEPVGHTAHGRTAFRVHGDNSKGDKSASNGCIIASRVIREQWRDSGDRVLEVTL